jgi:hypothetical protein
LHSLPITLYHSLMKGKRYNLGLLCLLGAISGAGSYFLVQLTYWGVLFIPGLVFGVIIGLYFLRREVEVQLAWFITASMLSYSWAVLVVLYLTFGWKFLSNSGGTIIYNAYTIHSPIVLFLGGLIGTSFLLSSFHRFVSPLSRDASVIFIILGSVLSLSFFGGYVINKPSDDLSLPFSQLLALLVIWQAGMALSLGYSLSRPTRKK